ncbi:hypothetical protein EB796_021174 [Bugula neritina]|uniref:Uncharacterized protein n=1 Tax=Bugula neritina TaxID=10212 RepID=A0A7J7J3T8_BUGNE|nr:hypothetical protein EB796_021174 [Bugula neritina]
MVENSSLKRRLCSETDSDCEQEDQCSSPLSQGSVSGDSGCFTMARKRRRGLIEKRRRDRINRSLNDLKNLIPTAHERQASSKLEKSEVLSLAVDHIKALTAQVESTSPQSLAIDYRSIGYRECMHEMANFLIHSEGVGPAHPMHARLLSHLHQQLSGYDQVLHSAPQQPQCPRLPSAAPLQAYSSQAISSYETVTICKPEPSLSPSYCSLTQLTSTDTQGVRMATTGPQS